MSSWVTGACTAPYLLTWQGGDGSGGGCAVLGSVVACWCTGKQGVLLPRRNGLFICFLGCSREIDRVLLAAFTVWHLCGASNGVHTKHPNSLAEQIKSYAEMIEQHLWSSMLINVDAALFTSSSRMGVGLF